jgi:predicted DNA-binding transcriptional regulator AlpA
MTNQSLVLRPKNAAAMLDVSIATFWRMCKDGRLQTIKISERCTAVRRIDIDNYLSSLK